MWTSGNHSFLSDIPLFTNRFILSFPRCQVSILKGTPYHIPIVSKHLLNSNKLGFLRESRTCSDAWLPIQMHFPFVSISIWKCIVPRCDVCKRLICVCNEPNYKTPEPRLTSSRVSFFMNCISLPHISSALDRVEPDLVPGWLGIVLYCEVSIDNNTDLRLNEMWELYSQWFVCTHFLDP